MKEVRCCSFCLNQLDEQMYLLGSYFCSECYNQFEFIVDHKGPTCSKCQKKIKPSSEKRILCEDCQYWENNTDLPLLKNSAVLYYNQFAHEVMERAKFMGDAEIWRGLAQFLSDARLLPKKGVQIIPSSQKTYLTRDFDHLAAIAQMLRIKTVDYVRKKEGVASQVVLKTVAERKKLKNAFEVVPGDKKEVIIFDDVYTTGSTLKDIQKAFQNKGIRVIRTVTIFRADLHF